MSDSRDENLLFGILALQLDFITQDQLIAAANAWMVSKATGLDEILVKLNSISQEDRDFVGLIVKKHIARSGSPKGSLDLLKQHEPVSNTESQVHTILHGGVSADSENGKIQHNGTTVWVPAEAGSARFIRLRELASGGLGIVSVARDQELEREVALKEMLQGKRQSSDAFERFVSEAKITGNLEHPGIVPIYGLGASTDGSPYYAMRLIRGKSLQEEIAILHGDIGNTRLESDFRRLDSEKLRRLLRSLALACNAVAYAHSRGVIHRDLKPGNIMLGKFGETIVVDWGLAKVTGDVHESKLRSEPPVRDSRNLHDSETVMGAVLGTPSYMSPEQASGRIDLIDRRADVFGLGACLYSILTNVAPFKGNTKAETIANARDHRLRPLRECDKHIPAALEAICLKAMAAEPSQRYQLATDLADDMDRWIAGEAVTAMPDPLLQRAFRWARRHQTLVTSTTVLLVTAFVGLAIASWLISEQRNIARAERDRANDAAKESDLQREKAGLALVRSRESNAVSLGILETFVEGLGDDGWAGVPQMESKRIEMVDLAVARFQKLYADNPDDLEIKAKMIRLLVRSANLYRMVGKLEQASKHFANAMELIDSLEVSDQLRDVGLSVVGDSLFDYANLIEAQDGAEAALVSSRQGIEICRKRLQLESAEPMAMLGLAKALIQLSSLQIDTAEFREAHLTAKEGRDQLRRLSATPFGKQAFYAIFDVVSYDLQIKALLLQEKYTEAESLIKEAESVFESARNSFPLDNNIEYFLIQIVRNNAQLTFKQGQFAAGKTLQLEAIERQKKLVESYPDTIEYRRTLSTLNAELGIELLLNNDLIGAKERSSLAISGIDSTQVKVDAAISELKPQAIALGLSLGIAMREGIESTKNSETLKLICGRLRVATPQCEVLRAIDRLHLNASESKPTTN